MVLSRVGCVLAVLSIGGGLGLPCMMVRGLGGPRNTLENSVAHCLKCGVNLDCSVNSQSHKLAQS